MRFFETSIASRVLLSFANSKYIDIVFCVRQKPKR